MVARVTDSKYLENQVTRESDIRKLTGHLIPVARN
jgi:hypothetical protein